MSKAASRSRVLRELAEEIIEEIAEAADIPEDEREDFATSLVRQWLTYDGHAALFVGDGQFDFALSRTPLGKPRAVLTPPRVGWVGRCARDCKVPAEEIPAIIAQLNRGQSAEVVNTEGVPLRLWVNPKEKKQGVEALVRKPQPVPSRRQIAADILEDRLDLDADELEALVGSLVQQWQKYAGHAALFLDGEELTFTLTDLGEGGRHVQVQRKRPGLEPVLGTLGFKPDAMPEVLAQLNLDQEVDFRYCNGIPSRMRYDPQIGKIRIVRPHIMRLTPQTLPPLCCPQCGAVLSLWREGERQQLCPHCGHTTALGERGV